MDSNTLADYHRRLLADRTRLAVLSDALRQSIVPGETRVADLGAGTGILGIIAATLGAPRVILYEREPEVAQWAEEFVASAGLSDRVFVYAEDSRYVLDPDPADLVISETLGNLGPDEGIAVLLDDARCRHLRPGGRILPGVLELVVHPVVSPAPHRELVGWIEDFPFPLERERLAALALGNAYVRRLALTDLAPWPSRCWTRYDFSASAGGRRSGRVGWTVPSPTTVYGFAHMWRAEFAGRWLTTLVEAPPTHWDQVYLPLPHPMELRTDERLEIELHADFDGGADPEAEEGGIMLSWEVDRRRSDGTRVATYSCGLGLVPRVCRFQTA